MGHIGIKVGHLKGFWDRFRWFLIGKTVLLYTDWMYLRRGIMVRWDTWVGLI